MKEVDEAAKIPPPPAAPASNRALHTRVAYDRSHTSTADLTDGFSRSSPTIWRGMQPSSINERTTLLRRQSLRIDYEAETGEIPTPMAGGTVLGIHNLAIVFPQFIVRNI